MALGTGFGGAVPLAHKLAAEEAHIVIVIENEDPIDLLDFTSSLTAIAREHELQVRATTPGASVEETRLLVVEVRKGSIILELLPALAPFVASMEYTNAAVQFVQNLAHLLDPLRKLGGRSEDATTQQLKNLGDMVSAVAKDSNGTLSLSARYRSGDVVQELRIHKEDAQRVVENTSAQRKEIEDRSATALSRVLMRLHQSSVEDLKVGKKTSEKGIVERVDMTPRPLIYVSDLAGKRIKDEIVQPDGNPYQKGFVVDVDVETVGGKPKVYRILAVHDVIDLGD